MCLLLIHIRIFILYFVWLTNHYVSFSFNQFPYPLQPLCKTSVLSGETIYNISYTFPNENCLDFLSRTLPPFGKPLWFSGRLKSLIPCSTPVLRWVPSPVCRGRSSTISKLKKKKRITLLFSNLLFSVPSLYRTEIFFSKRQRITYSSDQSLYPKLCHCTPSYIKKLSPSSSVTDDYTTTIYTVTNPLQSSGFTKNSLSYNSHLFYVLTSYWGSKNYTRRPICPHLFCYPVSSVTHVFGPLSPHKIWPIRNPRVIYGLTYLVL